MAAWAVGALVIVLIGCSKDVRVERVPGTTSQLVDPTGYTPTGYTLSPTPTPAGLTLPISTTSTGTGTGTGTIYYLPSTGSTAGSYPYGGGGDPCSVYRPGGFFAVNQFVAWYGLSSSGVNLEVTWLDTSEGLEAAPAYPLAFPLGVSFSTPGWKTVSFVARVRDTYGTLCNGGAPYQDQIWIAP